MASVLGCVLECDLQLGAVGDCPALVEMEVLLDDLGDPKFAEVLARGPDRLGGGFFPRGAAGPDDLDHAVHAHDVSFSGLPGPTAAGMAAGAVSRIVVIVCASPAQGLDLSMHMRERRARCAGPDFRGRSSRDHHRLASGRRSSLQLGASSCTRKPRRCWPPASNEWTA